MARRPAESTMTPERARQIADWLTGLIHPTRLLIVRRLATGPWTATNLLTSLGLTKEQGQPHLLLLLRSGVASARRHGRERHYELTSGRLDGADVVLSAHGCVFRMRLSALTEKGRAGKKK